MEDVLVIGSCDEPGTKITVTSAPGYMRSTLRVPGPCARPSASYLPRSSVSSARVGGSLGGRTHRGTTCSNSCGPELLMKQRFMPSANTFPPLFVFRDMAKYDKFERIAAKFGIRTNTYYSAQNASVQGGTAAPLTFRSMIGRPKPSQDPTNVSGRMFIREKSNVTRGEKDIISGICKNRTPLRKSKSFDSSRSRLVANSHSDAWLSERQNPDDSTDEEILNRCPCGSSDDPCSVSSARFVDFTSYPRVPAYMSMKCPVRNPRCPCCVQANHHHVEPNNTDSGSSVDTGGEENTGKLLPGRQQMKVPPINSKKGAVVICRADVLASGPDDYSPRTTMDVYLPRLSVSLSDTDEDSEDDDKNRQCQEVG